MNMTVYGLTKNIDNFAETIKDKKNNIVQRNIL